MKLWFETFGCRLNRAEALQREAELVAAGHIPAQGRLDADVIIVRGCSITARAQHDCEKLIHHLREKYPSKKIIVEGCLPDKTDPKNAALPNMVSSLSGDTPVVSTKTARAYLKIQDGCNGKCSFCIVPRFRGKSVCVPFDEVIGNAKAFIAAGYREIVVTGCNIALYESQGKHLPELIESLADISEDVRIRIGSVEPVKSTEKLIEAMASRPNICRFLHLTIQSGSDTILSAMRRPYNAKAVENIIRKASEAMPLIGLGCDLITGFPGESNLDFMVTKKLLKSFEFSNVHVFVYSERPGTAAADFSNAVPRELRKARAHDLSALAASARISYAKKFIGREVQYIVEDDDKISGWSGEYFLCKPSLLKPTPTAKRKELIKAIVTGVNKDTLITETIVEN